MKRVGVLAVVATAAVVVGIGLIPALAQEHGSTLYLAGPGFPQSILRASEPVADLPVDLDRGRDPAAGLTLEPGGDPIRESADEMHQDFQLDVSGYTLTGPARLRLWVAAPDQRRVTVVAHLLDCDRYGLQCVDLGGSSATVDTREAGEFVDTVLTLDLQEISFAPDRILELSITNAGDDSLWLAYDARTTPSRIHLDLTAPPAPTTTTVGPATTSPTPAVSPPTTIAAPPPVVTAPPPTVAPQVTTTAPTTTTPSTSIPVTSTAKGDPSDGAASDDELTALVFDYSGALAASVPAGGDEPTGLLTRLVDGWAPFRSALGAAAPWLVGLTIFGVGLTYVATREREATGER